MSVRQRLIDMIDFEVFLFQGVPERPDPVFGRDSHSSVHLRHTRRNVETTENHANGEDNASNAGRVLQEMWIDPDSGDLVFGPPLP